MDRRVLVHNNGHPWEVSIDPKKTLEEIVLELDNSSDTRPIKVVTLVISRNAVIINAPTAPLPQP